MEFTNLSLEEIQQQLEEIEANKAELERALSARREAEKYGVVQEVKDLIAERGYDLDEIIPLVTGRRRRVRGAAARSSGGSLVYKRYVDPENPENVYVRGVLPGWMKQKMQEQGYDPSVKADRESFKENYLQLLES